MSLLKASRPVGRFLRCAVAAVLGAAALVAAMPSAHADGPAASPTFVITNSVGPGWMLCATQNDEGTGAPSMRQVTRTISAYCQWQFVLATADYWYLYNPALNEDLTLNPGISPLANLEMDPQSAPPAEPPVQWWSIGGQSGYGGRTITAAAYASAQFSMSISGNLPVSQGYGPGALPVRPGHPNPFLQGESWQFTVLDPGATPPAASTTPAPFPLGWPDELMVDQSGGAGIGGSALCADAGDSNVSMQALTVPLNPYCIWEQGGPSGAPTNAYLYNPAKGLVLDLNSSTSPISDPTPVNMQAYYTDPLQTYEWWTTTQTDEQYTAVHPYQNTALNINAYTNPAITPAVANWSTGSTKPQMSWVFIPVS